MSDKLNQNEFDQDKSFQDLHENYQSVSTELPPASVDANILQAAHAAQAVQIDNKSNQKTPLKKSFKRTWYVPASAVAIIVLSLSVVLRLAFEPEYHEPANMHSPQIEMDRADYSAGEGSLQGSDPRLKQSAEMLEEIQMTSELERNKVQQPLLQSQSAPAQGSVSAEKKSLQKSKMKTSPLSSHDQAQAKAAAESRRVLKPANVTPMAEAPVSGVASTVGDLDALAKHDTDIHQKEKIRHLIMLFETQQFEQLESALRAYRKEYPVNYSGGGENEAFKNELLPEALLEWELNNRN